MDTIAWTRIAKTRWDEEVREKDLKNGSILMATIDVIGFRTWFMITLIDNMQKVDIKYSGSDEEEALRKCRCIIQDSSI